MKQIFITVLLVLFLPYKAMTQNKAGADSAIALIDAGKLSLTEQFETYRYIAHNHPDFSEAISFARQALKTAGKIGDPFLKAQAYEEIGANERLLGNIAESTDAALKALEIFDELGEDVYRAASYVQLGANLMSDGEPDRAIPYLQTGKSIYASSSNKLNYALTIINLGEAYRLNNQLDSAVVSFRESLSLNSTLKQEIIEGYARGNLGMALRSQGQLEEAKVELNPAIRILTELGDPYSVSVYTAELGQISLIEGKTVEAEERLLKAYALAKEEGLKEQIRDVSKMLTGFYEEQIQFEKALIYQKEYQVYQDSLVNKANVQQIERLKANYEIDKRQGEIDLLSTINNNQKTFSMALGGGILIFGVLAVMLYQSNKQKNEANGMLVKQQSIVSKREEEKALLLKELNHRVKNNLQMVSSLLNLQENQLAGHPAATAINSGKLRVEALSLIHQKLYQDDVHTSINIREYLEQLISNLFYSYADPFKPDIDIVPIDMEMDIDTAIPVSLIVNELVTNALKYAYQDMPDAKLRVSLRKPNGHYNLEITDNGIGMNIDDSAANSYGLKLVRSLVDQLEGTLELRETPGGGTSWSIMLRLHKNAVT